MEKKRIYFLINSLEAGGAERVLVNLSESLATEYDIDIITLKGAKFYSLPDNVHHIPMSTITGNIGMIFLFPYYLYRFRQILRTNLYTTGVSSLELSNFIHILSKKNASICFEINITFFQGIIGFFYKLGIRLLYPHAGKIKVNSEENKISLASYLSLPDEKIVSIYNPIHLEKIRHHNIDEEKKLHVLERAQGRKIFITVGRLVWQKKHIKILEAFRKLTEQGRDDFYYIIIGDGPEREGLEKFVHTHKLSNNVSFMGSQSDVMTYLKLSNYFVYASEIEGFPNVLTESIAAGVPIITSLFKTGAQEAILAQYDKNILYASTDFPIEGPNGFLLDGERFVENFCALYPRLLENQTVSKQLGLEKFEIHYVSNLFKMHFL